MGWILDLRIAVERGYSVPRNGLHCKKVDVLRQNGDKVTIRFPDAYKDQTFVVDQDCLISDGQDD